MNNNKEMNSISNSEKKEDEEEVKEEELSSFGSAQNLRKGGGWFGPLHGKYSLLSHCCPLFRQWL